MGIINHLNNLRAASKRPDTKGLLRQLFDCSILYATSRMGPGFYLMARLYENHIDLAHICSYQSGAGYKSAIYRLNDPLMHRASQHKAIEKSVLITYGLPTPALIGYFHAGGGRTIGGQAFQSLENLTECLAKMEPGAEFCVKRVNGWGGEGFRAFRKSPNSEIEEMNGSKHEISGLAGELAAYDDDGFVIESYLQQHETLSRYNSSSVNTLRIVLLQESEATPSISPVLGFLRVGRSGRLVDNATSGAIVFPVDLDTGLLAPGFSKYDPTNVYSAHPDSAVQIAGTVLPDFDQALGLAKQALALFPGIRFAGVDVAFAQDGPVILELNVWPDYAGFGYCQTPSKRVFARSRYPSKNQ